MNVILQLGPEDVLDYLKEGYREMGTIMSSKKLVPSLEIEKIMYYIRV